MIVNTQLRGCPAGDYVLFLNLVQDGISYPLASTALGVGEFELHRYRNRPAAGDELRRQQPTPGVAEVTATIYRQADGMPVLTEAASTVRIPAGYNQP